jgi:6-phosphogluconolactonase
MNLHLLPLQDLGGAAALYVSHLSAQAVTSRGRFSVALSGGSLIKLLCPPLITLPLSTSINWSAWHIFWADERCVPLAHPDSNYRLAREYLFDHVPIPSNQIYPVETSLDPAAAATAYQATLGRVLQPAPTQIPRFDLILLGLGEDGHTASLFPGHSLLNETERWVAPVFNSPKPPPKRVTLTLPVINDARQVLFLVTGSSKADALQRVLQTPITPGSLPARLVQPAHGELHWFVDEAAGAKLNQ